MRIFLWFFQTALALMLLMALGLKWGPLPILGPFLSPFEGFWCNAEPSSRASNEVLQIPGLEHSVQIAQDARGVPHLFAATEKDLYVAQGFVTARDRLWEMDIVTREAGGRLAEVMGRDLLDHDKLRRRYGLLAAAQAMEGSMRLHEGTWKAVNAYCEGVNAYLASVTKKEWPLEFKMLDYAPESWTPLKTALLIASMQWTLSAGKHDQPLTATYGKYGGLFFQKFFPPRDEEEPPIIPSGTIWPFKVKPTLALTDTNAVTDTTDKLLQKVKSDSGLPSKADLPANYHGSNNFVLGPSRTKNGKPLLANDPHLDLTLPSTWYELQLHSPGMNAYGVSLPGAPGLVIGFNDSLAWGLTNGGDDVFDWYRLQFRDSTLSDYFYDGRWIQTRARIDTLKIRGGDVVFDTVILSHHGPVVLREPDASAGRNVPLLHALRWLAHDSSDEVGALLRIQGCGTVACFETAMQGFACPAQNFAVASITGDIGIFHMGHLPWKWPGQGRFVLDGSDSRQDWQGWVPPDRIPAAINPPQGYLFSANQEPTDTTYPYHLGSAFTNPDRAVRLGQRLEHLFQADVDSAFSVMEDKIGYHAEVILPRMLDLLDPEALPNRSDSASKLLRQWNHAYNPSDIAPTLFEAWWQAFYNSIWSDDFAEDSSHYDWPNLKVTRQLVLNDSNSEWFDDVRTPRIETLRDQVNAAYRTALTSLQSEMGKDLSKWQWSRRRPVSIKHLLRLGPFSWDSLSTGGCPDCIDAQRANHGPSWRMAVSLSNPPIGYGIYPGGQSGNPGSRHFDDFIADWAAGRRYVLQRLAHLPASTDTAYVRLSLEPP